MAVVNRDEPKVVFEKNDMIDVSPNPVPIFNGNQIIGVSRVGDIQAGAPQLDSITKTLQSPNFKQGTTGWRLNSNGILEANGAIIT